MGKRRGREGGSFEDQYGDGMMSQDRGDRPSFGGKGGGGSGGGFTGGGEAGGGKKDSNIQYIRSVPKFLQGHMHLLGRKPPQEHEEAQLASLDELKAEQDSDGEEDKEGLEQALRENPELAKQYPELQSVADSGAASEAKEAGNRAFAANSFDAAVKHFSDAIALKRDPIFYSNRAAAYHALKRYEDAAQDARQVIVLDRKWVKGWSRLAAALYALEEWSEAKDAYAEAVKLEPSDTTLQSMWHSAEVNETKQEAEGKIKYKKSRAALKTLPKGRDKTGGKLDRGKKSLLSFDDDPDAE